MSKVYLPAFAGLFTLLLLPFFVSAQTGTPCNQFQSGSMPPAGYGAAWNQISAGRELLVSAACDTTSPAVTHTVGMGANNHYVYKLGYYFDTTWKPFTMTGTFAQGTTEWIHKTGTYIFSSPPSSNYFWVGYVCQWQNTAQVWKCGCRDAACASPFWQLQQVQRASGGSTGGATGGRTAGSIPANACWKYDSATLSSTDISRWNSIAAGWDANKSAPHKITWFDDDRKHMEIRHNFTHQACSMTTAGMLACEYAPGDSNKHSDITMHGSSCAAHLKTVEHFSERKDYAFGFKMCFPTAAATWRESFIILQIWSGTGVNPPISLQFKGTDADGPRLEVRVTGDTRSEAQIEAAGRVYQFDDRRTVLASVKGGSCHDVVFDMRLDNRVGGQGSVRMWLDGTKVYDVRERVGAATQVGYTGEHWTPIIGVYAYGGSNALLKMTYDKMWLAAQ